MKLSRTGVKKVKIVWRTRSAAAWACGVETCDEIRNGDMKIVEEDREEDTRNECADICS